MTKSSLEMVVRSLNEAGVAYLIVGGLAVVAHGYLRCTVDIDLLLDFERTNMAKAAAVFGKLEYSTKSAISVSDLACPILRGRLVESGQYVVRLRSPLHDMTGVDVLACDPIGFEAAFARRMVCELASVVMVPICAYEDLLRMKRMANRPIDGVDSMQLEKARSSPTERELSDPWFVGTFEGCELSHLREWAGWPFATKVASLEESHDLARVFQRARRKLGGGQTMRASGLIEDV
jgi:hypothetical protein